MKDHPNWKKRLIRPDGYIEVLLESKHPYREMAKPRGYILEHRLVMAQHLNRMLRSNEIVHHKNSNRADNRLSNLVLLSRSQHPLNQTLALRQRILELESENAELKDRLSKYEG